jgi:hypothetical protein
MFDNSSDREALHARILYSTFIRTALVAWNNGCDCGNPRLDVRELDRRHDLIFSAVESLLLGNARTDTEMTDSRSGMISALHRAALRGSTPLSCSVAGENSLDTLSNIILYFEKMIEKRNSRKSRVFRIPCTDKSI